MFEIPEIVTLSRQINAAVAGKTVRNGNLGNTPHKFVWYNRTHQEFAELTCAKQVGVSYGRGRWLFMPLEPGYVLVLGECGGKMLYHAPGDALPKNYHLLIQFEDGSSFSATTQMWGAMELYESGQELLRPYIKDMRPTPLDEAFSWEYFDTLLQELCSKENRSVKGLLTQDQLIPGLGNAIAQDILFQAGLHPKRSIRELNAVQRRTLFDAIGAVVKEIIDQGGRYDEYDLFNQPGGYVRMMDKKALQKPCPVCGGEITKIQYLGGACYFCPRCQE